MDDDGPQEPFFVLLLLGVIALLSASVVCATASSRALQDLVLLNVAAVVQDVQGGLLLAGVAVIAFAGALLLWGWERRPDQRIRYDEQDARWRTLFQMRWTPLAHRNKHPEEEVRAVREMGVTKGEQNQTDPTESPPPA